MVRELFKSYKETKLNCIIVITICVTLSRAFYYFLASFYLKLLVHFALGILSSVFYSIP